MNKCLDIIKEIYEHPKVNSLIGKIHPTDLQDDLKQEMAMVLLTYDCKKLLKIKNEGDLIAFTLRIIWKMGTLQKGYFYKTYKQRDIIKAYEWMKSQIERPVDNDKPKKAATILADKLNASANEAHESMIFSKYVELKSHQRVADYFGIPRLHILKVVNKTKKELKEALK